MNVDLVAAKYGMDAAALKTWLDYIRQQYLQNEIEYDKAPDKQDYAEELASIRLKAQRLSDKLSDASYETKKVLQGEDMLIHHTNRYLEMLIERIDSVDTSIKGRTPDFNRNCLGLDLCRSWLNLTGNTTSEQSNGCSFKEFINDACVLIAIDPTGIWHRHRKDFQ